MKILNPEIFSVKNITGVVSGRTYSQESFSVPYNTDRGIIIPTPGSIFEVKYKNDDIVGFAR